MITTDPDARHLVQSLCGGRNRVYIRVEDAHAGDLTCMVHGPVAPVNYHLQPEADVSAAPTLWIAYTYTRSSRTLDLVTPVEMQLRCEHMQAIGGRDADGVYLVRQHLAADLVDLGSTERCEQGRHARG